MFAQPSYFQFFLTLLFSSAALCLFPANARSADPYYDVRSYQIAGISNSVAVGDFNRDGNPDLATANFGDGQGAGTTSVLLGNGDGTFGTRTDYNVGEVPNHVTPGDFNGDGITDLAVVNLIGGSVSILIGVGDGSFEPEKRYGFGGFPFTAAAGQFDRDGFLDLAVLVGEDGQPNRLELLYGDGQGGFKSHTDLPLNGFSGSTAPVVAGDFDRDGITDLAVPNNPTETGAGRITILLGRGDGSFRSGMPIQVSSSVMDLVAGDINQDGNTDLLMIGDNYWGLELFLGHSDGTFQPAMEAHSSFPQFTIHVYQLSVGDFNGDGFPDIAAIGGIVDKSGGVMLFYGDGKGGFPAEMDHALTGPSSVASGDFNRDGKLDLAVVNNLFNNHTIYVTVINRGLGDVNSDGFLNMADAVLALRYITGTVEFTAAQKIDADLNLDRSVDVADVVAMLRLSVGINP